MATIKRSEPEDRILAEAVERAKNANTVLRDIPISKANRGMIARESLGVFLSKGCRNVSEAEIADVLKGCDTLGEFFDRYGGCTEEFDFTIEFERRMMKMLHEAV
ncbi:hypothetical protein FWG86_00745 [Candidatus Saccharibacteria bacterium]|nr:hypothetical protein [Candidatus Saccharibacteria bacterium]